MRPSEFGRAVPGHASLPVQKNGLESCPWANAQSGFAAEGGGAVGALPGESRLVAAAVRGEPAVAVDDDLAAGQAGVADWAPITNRPVALT